MCSTHLSLLGVQVLVFASTRSDVASFPVSSGPAVFRERKRSRSHKFLCLRVGKPMKKTFLSNASASMQQYAQRHRKLEYWFAVPQER